MSGKNTDKKYINPLAERVEIKFKQLFDKKDADTPVTIADPARLPI